MSAPRSRAPSSVGAGSALRANQLPRLLSAVSCVCACWLALGCEQDEPPERETATTDLPTTKPASGPRSEDPDFEVEAHPPRLCPTDGPLAPAAGFVRLSVPVTITGKSERDLIVSAFDFSLTNEEGHVHRPTLASCGAPFARSQLAKGESHRGELTFDVKRGPGPFELQFQPFIIGRQEVTARVRVPVLPDSGTREASNP